MFRNVFRNGSSSVNSCSSIPAISDITNCAAVVEGSTTEDRVDQFSEHAKPKCFVNLQDSRILHHRSSSTICLGCTRSLMQAEIKDITIAVKASKARDFIAELTPTLDS